MTLYNFTSGTKANAGDVNSNFNISIVAQGHALVESLWNSQDAAITPKSEPDGVLRDVFSDSDGYLNSVDTGNTDALYDTTTKSYKFPDYFVIIEATSVSGSYAINNCVLQAAGTGRWLLYSTSVDVEVQRAEVIKTLFYGTDGSDPRAEATYMTSPTAFKSSDSRDIGKRAHYADNISGTSGLATYTGTFVDTTNNTSCSSWSIVRAQGNGVGGTRIAKWEMPSGTVLNEVSANFSDNLTIDETGTDTSADELNNPADCQLETNRNIATQAWVRAIILCSGDITWATSGTATFSNTDFYTDNSIPDFEAITTSDVFVVQTNALTLSGDNIDSVGIYAQNDNDGTNLITYDVSSDNGSTYITGLSLNRFYPITSTLNNQLIVKYNIPADTDIKMYGYAIFYGRA